MLTIYLFVLLLYCHLKIFCQCFFSFCKRMSVFFSFDVIHTDFTLYCIFTIDWISYVQHRVISSTVVSMVMWFYLQLESYLHYAIFQKYVESDDEVSQLNRTSKILCVELDTHFSFGPHDRDCVERALRAFNAIIKIMYIAGSS